MEILFIASSLFGFVIGGLLVFLSYRQGIIDGQKVKQEKPIAIPKPNKKIEVIPDEYLEGLQNIMNYDGKPVK